MNIEHAYITDIKNILASARAKAYYTINSAMVEAYWQIGKRIVEEEQHGERRATYGEKLLETLSKSLSKEFGKGFSYANLRNFRQFYLTYPDVEICYALCSKLSWSHNRLIMRVQSPEARTYYLKESVSQGWSARVLERQIAIFYYQRIIASQTSFLVQDQVFEGYRLEDFVKDPYVFEFLNIEQPQNASEKEIETGANGKLISWGRFLLTISVTQLLRIHYPKRTIISNHFKLHYK
jgi:DUF1016 N-terminal domain